MACPSSGNTLFEQVLCIINELGIVYTDCDGVVQGDCGMCIEGGGDGTTNTIAFNPATNTITTVVNGIAAFTVIALTATDVVTTAALTIGGTLYATGTPVQTILAAIVALSHPAASVNVGSNPALTVVGGTQVFNLNLSQAGSYNNSFTGLTADNVQDAIDEVYFAAAPLTTPGSLGDFLIHNGTVFVQTQRIEETIVGSGSNIVNIASLPLTGAPFDLYRNGNRLVITDDYTRALTVITLSTSLLISEKVTAIYYI